MKRPKGKRGVLEVLEKFRNKGAAWQAYWTAERLLRELKRLLNEYDWQALRLAREHFLLGEGPDELYKECRKLKEKLTSKNSVK